jgi:hypothetical protein
MAWQWSHTTEAYTNAYNNLHALSQETLAIILAEWEAVDDPDEWAEGFNPEKYEEALERFQDLPADALADEIWPRMEALATCTNGGWAAWACPDGCHLVSFSKPDEEDYERI